MKIKNNQFCDFLVKAKKAGYASGDWSYYDNYFGGEPYGGEEVVFFKNQPVYMMVYYGSVDKSVKDFKEVYKCLQEALTLIPKDKPFRGPKFYQNGDYAYRNWFNGKVDNFSGIERIYFGRKKIYYYLRPLSKLI